MRLDQTYPKHKEYLEFLYSIFSKLTGPKGQPKIYVRKPDSRTGKIYSTIAFKTRAFSSLASFHDLFYDKGRKKKIISNNIADLITPISLAFWIMDDGSITTYKQTVLHTNSYTKDEIILLQSALYIKFKLQTRLICKDKVKNQWLIVIPIRQQIPRLQNIVSDYMHDTMKLLQK